MKAKTVIGYALISTPFILITCYSIADLGWFPTGVVWGITVIMILTFWLGDKFLSTTKEIERYCHWTLDAKLPGTNQYSLFRADCKAVYDAEKYRYSIYCPTCGGRIAHILDGKRIDIN